MDVDVDVDPDVEAVRLYDVDNAEMLLEDNAFEVETMFPFVGIDETICPPLLEDGIALMLPIAEEDGKVVALNDIDPPDNDAGMTGPGPPFIDDNKLLAEDAFAGLGVVLLLAD